MSKWEWLTIKHRDTAASLIAHNDMLSYQAIVENETKARIKNNLLEKMIQPCGPPPPELTQNTDN